MTCYIELSDGETNSPDLQLLSVRCPLDWLLTPSWASITSLDCIERVSSLRFSFLLPPSSDYDFLTPFLPSPSDTALCLRIAIASHDDFARVKNYIDALPTHLLPGAHPSAAHPEVSLSQTVQGCKSSVVALAAPAEAARSSTVILPIRQVDASPTAVPATQKTPSLPTTPVAARKRSQDALGSLHSTPQRPEKAGETSGVGESEGCEVKVASGDVKRREEKVNEVREARDGQVKEVGDEKVNGDETVKTMNDETVKTMNDETVRTMNDETMKPTHDTTPKPNDPTPKPTSRTPTKPSPHTPKRLPPSPRKRKEAETVSSQLAALSRRRPGGFLSQLAEEMAETGARRAETRRAAAPRGERQRKGEKKSLGREPEREKEVELPVSKPVEKEAKEEVKKPADKPVEKEVEKPVEKPMGKTIDKPTSQSDQQSPNQPTSQPVNNPPINPPTNQATTTNRPTTKQPPKRRTAKKPIQREPEPQDFSEDEGKPLIATKQRATKRASPATIQTAGRKKARLGTHTDIEQKEPSKEPSKEPLPESSEAESEASVEISQLMNKLKSVLATPHIKDVTRSADTSPQSNGSESDEDLEDPSILAVQQALTSRRPTHFTRSAPPPAEEREAEADPAGAAAAGGDRAWSHRQTARRHGGSATDRRQDGTDGERATHAESAERNTGSAESPRDI